MVAFGQGFPGTDSLRRYNIKYITNNAATAFTNHRLNTLLAGVIDWIDSARVGEGGVVGVDTIGVFNDSTLRYRKNGVWRNITVKGVYDHRRKVDTAYNLNDSTIRFLINGSARDVILPGANNRWEIDDDGNLVNKPISGTKIEINKRLSGLDSGYVFTSNLTGSNPGEGTGHKNFWHPGKSAWRNGYAPFTAFNDDQIGLYSISSGYEARAPGLASAAFGIGVYSPGQASIAFGGSGTQSPGDNSLSGGLASVSGGNNSIALGNSSNSPGENSVAIGFNPSSEGANSAAFNAATRAKGRNSFATGEGSDANATNSFVAGAFNQTNYSLVIPQFVIGRFSDTTIGSELFRIGWGSITGGAKANIFSVDTAGSLRISRPEDGDPEVDSLLVWDNADKKVKKVAPGSGGGSGGATRTMVQRPIDVLAGDSALAIPDTVVLNYGYGLTIDDDSTLIVDSSVIATQYDLTQINANPAGSNTQVQFNASGSFGADADLTYNSTTNIFTSGDYKFGANSNFLASNRAKLYSGIETNRWRDSTRESRFIIRFPFDGAGIITPTFIQDADHELVGYDSIKAVSSDVVTYRPTVSDVHSIWVQQDETLAKLVGGFGPSVGLTSTTIRGYRHSTWGGAIYWNSSTRVWYADGAVINDNVPGSITYDSLTGILTMTMTTWMTTGSERDYKKLAANMSQEGFKVTFMVQNSSNTLLQFKITDIMGSVVPPYMFDNTTAFTFIMPTWHSQLPLGDIGGGNSWLQNFITSQSNIWGGQTDKRN